MTDPSFGAFNRSSRDEVLEAVGSTRMNDEDFVPTVNGNFKRAASFRQSIRGRRLPSSAASPAGVRRTPSMRTNNTIASGGTSTTMSSSPTATNALDDISDDVGEDAVAEEFFSQLSQMNDRIAAMTQAQAEKELQAKTGEQRLMQENGRLQERCASLEMQYADLERHYQQLMQKEREHFKQMQTRAEQERDFMQSKWEEEKQQLKQAVHECQRENADSKKHMELEKAELERMRVEKPWLEEKASREASQLREALQDMERLRSELQESKQEQEQLDASYQDEIKALQSQIADLSYSSTSGDHEHEQMITGYKSQIDRLRQENSELREQNTELHLTSTASGSTTGAPAGDSLASQLAEAAMQGGYAGKLLGYNHSQLNGARDSRSNSSGSDVIIQQQREVMRNKSTTCSVCKKKDEEFFRVQKYLENLVQRVIDTHPEILEIRPPKTTSLLTLPKATVQSSKSSEVSSSTVATNNPFDTTNPFEEEEGGSVEDTVSITTTSTRTVQDDGKRGESRDSMRMQVDEQIGRAQNSNDRSRVTAAAGTTASSVRPTTPVAPAVTLSARNRGNSSNSNASAQKTRAPRPPVDNNVNVGTPVRSAPSSQQRNRKSGTPVSEC